MLQARFYLLLWSIPHYLPQSSLVFSIYFILCPFDLRSEHWRYCLGKEVSHIKNMIIKKKNTAALVKFNLKVRHKVLQSKTYTPVESRQFRTSRSPIPKPVAELFMAKITRLNLRSLISNQMLYSQPILSGKLFCIFECFYYSISAFLLFKVLACSLVFLWDYLIIIRNDFK